MTAKRFDPIWDMPRNADEVNHKKEGRFTLIEWMTRRDAIGAFAELQE